MFDHSQLWPPALTITVKVLLTIWFIILVPWIPFVTLMGTGMAFEGGRTFGAYLFIFEAWTYPILVGVAYYCRRRKPALVWLPILILAPVFLFSGV